MQEISPPEEMRLTMTNPQPGPLPILPFSPAEPEPHALRLATPTEAPVHSTLQDEIRLLRARGLSDECILGLFGGFHIDANPEPFGPYWKLPLDDQLIGLIWGHARPASRLD